MSDFDPQSYGDAIARLVPENRSNELGPGRPRREYRPLLEAMTVEDLFAHEPVVDRSMALACLAGLWLLHNELDRSHAISQKIDSTTGSYWHGIMHRREPDFSNAKYWFRRVGQHPIFASLHEAARNLVAGAGKDPATEFLRSGDAWDPFRFVDLCEAALAGRAAVEPLCREIQRREWELLFDYCYRHAIGA